ncbi:MAG: ATP-binding protein [Lachnospiraceae bacterium]
MQVKEHLSRAIQLNKINHAYIFVGDLASELRDMAEYFAKCLQCTAYNQEPCDMCQSCLQVTTGNHPDILYLHPEKETSIGVDDIRSQINDSMITKPYQSRYKVYVVENAHKMTAQAQNALLKTLEEPPSYGVIILLTNNAKILLPTIRSRCVILNFDFVDEQRKIETDEGYRDLRQHCYSTLDRIPDMSVEDIMAAVKEIAEYKPRIMEYLDCMLCWFRDALVAKEQGENSEISYQKMNKNIMAVENARERISANVNLELTLQLLLFTIKEKQ